jgi:dTDP-4-dehydrorhamnose 3,5-epimerase
VKLVPTEIPDVVVVESPVHADDRGFFLEAWNEREFRGLGIDATFVQCNHSRSRRGVVRGLHYQIPGAQGKLVRVTSGSIWDVAVDLRRRSTTFGRWVGLPLAAGEPRALWIPPGFAHGFCATSDADVLYLCTAPYDPKAERTVLWNDPGLAIAWPLAGSPVVSVRDAAGVPFAVAEVYGN